MVSPMENRSDRTVGLKVITNGIISALHHYILAYQVEKVCGRGEAVQSAIKLVDDLKKLLLADLDQETREETNGHSETGSVSKEGG